MEIVKTIGLDSILTQAVGLVDADMDGNRVMLNIQNGNYYGLDNIGSRVWELIEKPHSLREIVAVLLNEYDVEENTCKREMLTFINCLHDKGLVEID